MAVFLFVLLYPFFFSVPKSYLNVQHDDPSNMVCSLFNFAVSLKVQYKTLFFQHVPHGGRSSQHLCVARPGHSCYCRCLLRAQHLHWNMRTSTGLVHVFRNTCHTAVETASFSAFLLMRPPLACNDGTSALLGYARLR